MQKKLRRITHCAALGALLVFTLSGCTYLKFPGVYRIAVLQGNIVDPEKLDQLEEGMTKRQVQFLMGSALIEDIFAQDRWDYIYVLRRGDKTLRKRRLTVFFEGDTLVKIDGDYTAKDKKIDNEDYIEDAKKTES